MLPFSRSKGGGMAAALQKHLKPDADLTSGAVAPHRRGVVRGSLIAHSLLRGAANVVQVGRRCSVGHANRR